VGVQIEAKMQNFGVRAVGGLSSTSDIAKLNLKTPHFTLHPLSTCTQGKYQKSNSIEMLAVPVLVSLEHCALDALR
jgi:hypothetical protein